MGWRPVDDQSAQEYWGAAGMEVVTETLYPMQIDIHPNDLRKRIPPDGPLSQEWAGVQKVNPIAGVGTRFAELDYSPLTSSRLRTGTVNLNNPVPDFYGSGPVPVFEQEQATLDSYGGTPQQGLLRTLLGRLTGNG